MEELLIHDKGPLRELIVNNQVRVRLKRHHGSGAIATYPTEEALRFYSQHPSKGQLVLFDNFPEMTNLVFGYIWDRELGEIGAATVSYPISRERSLWVREIGPPPPSHVITPSQPDAPTPIFELQTERLKTRRDLER